MKIVENNTIPFSIQDYKKGGYEVVTVSGFKVDILSLEYSDPVYRVVGHISKSTQLESWTSNGKYYSKEKRKDKYNNQNNLLLIKA